MDLTATQLEGLDKLFGDKRITDDAQYMLLAETLGLGDWFRLTGVSPYIKECLRLHDLARPYLRMGKLIGKNEWLRFCRNYGHKQTPDIRPSTTELVKRVEAHVAKYTKDFGNAPVEPVRFIDVHGNTVHPENVPQDSFMYLELASTLNLSEILHRQQTSQ